MGHFYKPKIINFEIFSESVHKAFLKLYLMAGIKNLFKVTVLDF